MTVTMMRMEDVLNLESGDHGGPMRDVLDKMWCDRSRGNGSGFLKCHDYILEIALRMEEHGWDGPPVCVQDEAPFHNYEGPTLANGHHRTMAAWLLGMEEIPTTDLWSESDLPEYWSW